jgi:AraC-like DNA-binding protein
MILSLGDGLWVTGPTSEGATAVTSFVAGMHDRPALTEHDGRQHGIQVDVTPLAACRLFGVPMCEMLDLVVPLGDVLGRRGEELTARVSDARIGVERFAVLEGLLASLVDDGPQPAPKVAWLCNQLAEPGGNARVTKLADEVGWSRRHLEVRFRQQVGVAPKTYARLVRFRRAVLQLTDHGSKASLARVALECGYYDQAHFNRDFRVFAGCRPGAVPGLGGRCLIEVASVQDGPQATTVEFRHLNPGLRRRSHDRPAPAARRREDDRAG